MLAGINTVRVPQHPIQERKLNFFVDYYRYYVHFAGLLPTFEIETPYSLVDKIIFQLNHNITEKCHPYLKNHFNKLKSYPPSFINHFKNYKEVIQWYESWPLDRNLSRFLTNNMSAMMDSLRSLHAELKDNMLKDSIAALKNMILCEHPLEKHKKAILFHTNLLAAEIIMIRNSKAEARELFDYVMTNEYKKFPYPKHLSTDEDKRLFFDSKTISETLSAINDFSLMEALEWDVNFKIDDLTMPEDYVFTHDQVQIFPSNHFDKEQMVEFIKHSDDPFVRTYFDGNKYAIAEIRVKSVTYEGAHRDAVRELMIALDYMSQTLGRSVSFKKGNYIFSTDRKNYGYSFKDAYFSNVITQVDRLKLEDNAYQFFERNNSRAKQEFLSHEKYYIKARGDQNIARLWGYLEIMFGNGTQKKAIKKFCSGALMLFEKQYRVPQINTYLRNAIHPFSTKAEYIGLTIDEQTTAIRLDKDFKDLNRRITSDFFHLAFKDHYIVRTKKWIITQRKAYYSLFEETYEQRNMSDHNGKMNTRAITKLSYTLPMLMARMRWLVFDYIKRHPTYSLTEINQAIWQDIDRR